MRSGSPPPSMTSSGARYDTPPRMVDGPAIGADAHVGIRRVSARSARPISRMPARQETAAVSYRDRNIQLRVRGRSRNYRQAAGPAYVATQQGYASQNTEMPRVILRWHAVYVILGWQSPMPALFSSRRPNVLSYGVKHAENHTRQSIPSIADTMIGRTSDQASPPRPQPSAGRQRGNFPIRHRFLLHHSSHSPHLTHA